MFLKVSLTFLLLGCVFTTTLASPSKRIRRYAPEDSSPFKDAGKSFKEFSTEIEKSFKELTKDTQWIYNNFVSIIKSSYEEGFQTIATWFVDLVLRMEFLAMADGSHFMFPLSGKQETEQQYRTVSIAVSKLLMNLKTMERTDKVIKNVTKNLVSKDIGLRKYNDHQQNTEKMFRTFLHEYFDALDHQLEADEVLRGEYKDKVAEARETVLRDPKMKGPFVKYDEEDKLMSVQERMERAKKFFQGKKTFLRAVANKIFLKQSAKHFTMIFSTTEHKRYLLARALIQKAVASPTSESKYNDIYHRALVKAEDKAFEDDDVIEDVLFESLEKELLSDPSSNVEIKFFMDEIERNTTYDTEMLYVDFSPL